MKGKLDVGNPRNWWLDTITDLAAIPLGLHPQHVSEINNLPPLHQDPFDRALIAQALVEDLTLLSTDGQIQRYASDTLRVIS
jgi:PIN domain nuclease of toxin-antitoxin system